MALDRDAVSQAIGAYFGPRVLLDEPVWCSVLVDEAVGSFETVEDLREALDLMRLEAVPA